MTHLKFARSNVRAILQAAATVLTGTLLAAVATPILDQYQGGIAPAGHTDVVGDPADFDIASMDASRTGTKFRVVMNTTFAGKAGVFGFATYDGNGVGYGDLFLANSWTPSGAAPYATDTAFTGRHWQYGFALDNRYSNTGGSGYLYALNGATNDADTLLSTDFINCGAGCYRQDQAVAVDLASMSVTQLGAGPRAVDMPNKTVSLDFDLTGTTLLNDDSLALHWDMLYANDVIEGEVPVSAPETAPLFGVGVLALIAIRRRRTKR